MPHQWLIDMSDNPDLNDALAFLREKGLSIPNVFGKRLLEIYEILFDWIN
ncbi:Manganese containing catalase [Seinonella peptonophila]|uniref:Manganese containing catalase n=1 Tax=Seinonella peptonophila TaxID=112248 RepID=A0A1M4T6X4_9BACL|nr:Manganese containing catalase [Seinonella peptonophila]